MGRQLSYAAFDLTRALPIRKKLTLRSAAC